MNNHLLSILYDPSKYADSSHIPDFFVQGHGEGTDRLINYWLCKGYQLLDIPEDFDHHNIINQLIITNWNNLTLISKLIGGFILRKHLLSRINDLMINPILLSFISLPLVCQISMDNQIDNFDISAYGISFILNLASNLSFGLKQRMLLHFPLSIDIPRIEVNKTLDNINILSMAVSYAKNYNR